LYLLIPVDGPQIRVIHVLMLRVYHIIKRPF